MANENICKFNKSGYCKFKTNCKYKHSYSMETLKNNIGDSTDMIQRKMKSFGFMEQDLKRSMNPCLTFITHYHERSMNPCLTFITHYHYHYHYHYQDR